MARGQYLSLEEARKSGELNQFAKEHPIEDVHRQARSRFKPVLEAAAKGLLEGEETSGRAASDGYIGTRTRPNTSEFASD